MSQHKYQEINSYLLPFIYTFQESPDSVKDINKNKNIHILILFLPEISLVTVPSYLIVNILTTDCATWSHHITCMQNWTFAFWKYKVMRRLNRKGWIVVGRGDNVARLKSVITDYWCLCFTYDSTTLVNFLSTPSQSCYLCWNEQLYHQHASGCTCLWAIIST